MWRELRRAGAVALQAATWAIPHGDRFDEGLERAITLVERSGGHALCFEVSASKDALAAVERLYSAEREAEWSELATECERACAELRRDTQHEVTRARLREEERNVDRLRRWCRDLQSKDLFGAGSSDRAERRLKECAELVEALAERVHEVREHP